MAVADYFQRNVTAASQLLCGLDNRGLLKILNRHQIGLVIDGTVTTQEGRAAADLATRLLARFYPKLVLVALDSDAQGHVAELSKLAKTINPKISLSGKLSSATHCLVAGATPVALTRKGAKTVYFGSNNWLAKVSLKGPVGSGSTANPFAAGTAACLAVAKIFRVVFAEQLDPICATDDEVSLSLVTLSQTDIKPGPKYRTADVGKVYLVGAGAIGNGALWGLARSGVKGELLVVDPQDIELSNLQRYVMAVRNDVGSAKAEKASQWLRGVSQLNVVPHKQSWDDHARGSADWLFPRVLVALDTADARIGVQASLPKWIVNAWTRLAAMGVSRHSSLANAGGSCLACLYMPAGKEPGEDELVAAAFGFQTSAQHPELLDIRQRLHRNVLNDKPFLELIAAKKNVSIEMLLPFEGQPLRKLYTDGVCGGQVMGLTVDMRETRAEVPMAFQSALAGVLLAAELVIDVLQARGQPPYETTRIELLEPLKEYLATPSSKDARCLCQDKDYQDRYREKYG